MEETQEFKHVMPVQIRFNDMDKFGHVNNTVYFQFYDTAKTDYVFQVCPNVDWEKEAIIVVHIDSDFVAQITGQPHIAVRTRVSKIGTKSFHLEQEVFDLDNGELKSRCTSVMVGYNLVTHETMPIPEKWVESICRYEGKDLRAKKS